MHDDYRVFLALNLGNDVLEEHLTEQIRLHVLGQVVEEQPVGEEELVGHHEDVPRIHLAGTREREHETVEGGRPGRGTQKDFRF